MLPRLHEDVAVTFRALADPSRVRIVTALREREMPVCDLAAAVGISESGVSQHLRHLRQLRLVRGRRDGKHIYYQLDDDHVRDLLDICLAHVAGG